jgi:AraC family transcriptional regulator
VNLNVHQLLIAFRRNFGTTPAQYILTQRLRRARWHLLNGNADIADIAFDCGFASHSHLSAAFKRDTGITPRQFRDGLRMRATY